MHKPSQDPPPYTAAPAASQPNLVAPRAYHSTPALDFYPGTHIPPTLFSNGEPTNKLVVKTRHEHIAGKYTLDPALQTTWENGVNTHRCNGPRKPKRKGLFKSKEERTPTGVFQTRHGDINLDLAITAGPNKALHQGVVNISSRHGHANVNVTEIHPARRVKLQVTSRHGKVSVLVPRNFNGPIYLHSRHGRIIFLPALAANMRVVSRGERQALVLLGDGVPAGVPERKAQASIDSLHLVSRSGSVTVGLVGEDVRPVEKKTGLWRTITDFLGTLAKDD